MSHDLMRHRAAIMIIVIQDLYSAMEFGDTEVLCGARLRQVEQVSF